MLDSSLTEATRGYVTTLDRVRQRQGVTDPSFQGKKRSYEDSQDGPRPEPNQAAWANTANAAINAGATTRQKGRLHTAPANRLIASRIDVVSDNPRSSNTLVNGPWKIPSQLPVPGPSQNPLLSLAHSRYGLPTALTNNLASLGINGIYPWQSSCLLGRGLLDGQKNLVYTAPTGGGKSLVADVLMLKRVIEDASKKAILVLPYVALVQEKLQWLRKVLDGVVKQTNSSIPLESQKSAWRVPHTSSVRVIGLFGDSKTVLKWFDFDVAVCTIEKANGLINTAIVEGTIGDLGVLVLDELHMIDDDHRGYLLEVVASKILTLEHHVQIVGMSATLTNTEILASWLDAKFYCTKYVPVPLEEFLVYEHSIYATSSSTSFFRTASQLNSQSISDLVPVRRICPSEHRELRNPTLDAVVALAVETAAANYGALVFCGSRAVCQNIAAIISDANSSIASEALLDQRMDVLAQLRSLPFGIDETLEKTVPHGVAFHHAGLTAEEREIVAQAYDKGFLRVIVATCSLAAGINLPARRVILYGARMGRELIGPAMLRQMRGRAGRKGKDEIGESYLCCQKADLQEVVGLLEADLPLIQSGFTPENRGIKRALLEVITIRLATHQEAIEEYVRRTLAARTKERDILDNLVSFAMKELIDSGLVKVDKFGGYEATPLSQATVASYLSPDDGIFLHEELVRALRAFVMDGEMHVFYTFTPITISGATDINWPIFRKEIEALEDSGLRVLELVGVSPAFVNKMANSSFTIPEKTPDEIRFARVHRRFYTALQLRDLSNEMPIHAVARKYQVSRGSVQTLSQICEGFAGGVVRFCNQMGWGMLCAALDHMSDRLKAGARADLLDLARIPFVKSRTARVFWDNGFKGIRLIAEAEATDLVAVLELAQPHSRKARLSEESELKYGRKMMLKAEIIVNAATKLWERDQRQQDYDLEDDI